jgi:MFS family permease
MGATPNALVNDLVNEKERSHAMALLRTTGDLGLLLGATAGGFLAGMSSIEAGIYHAEYHYICHFYIPYSCLSKAGSARKNKFCNILCCNLTKHHHDC